MTDQTRAAKVEAGRHLRDMERRHYRPRTPDDWVPLSAVAQARHSYLVASDAHRAASDAERTIR